MGRTANWLCSRRPAMSETTRLIVSIATIGGVLATIRAMDRTLRSWVNQQGAAPRMWQRWTETDERLADAAVAEWSARPREKRRVSTVKQYIKALAVRWGRSENAVREHLRGRLLVDRERRRSEAKPR